MGGGPARALRGGKPPIFVPKKGFPDANLRALGVPVGTPVFILYSFFFILYYLKRTTNGRPLHSEFLILNSEFLILPDIIKQS